MKVLAVVLMFFVANNVELCVGELLEGFNPLDVHAMHNCNRRLGNGVPKEAYMGPCFNTPTCQIPTCCGIISGRDSLFRIIYEAKTPFRNGTFNGNLGGIGLGSATPGKDKQMLNVEIPGFQLLVPPTLAGYSRKLCDQTDCPQRYGETYTLDIPFRFVTQLMGTLSIKANFVASVVTDYGKQALCWGLWAELVPADLVPCVNKVVSDVLENPLSLLNPGKLLEKPLVGLINNEPWRNPFFNEGVCTPE